MEENPLSDTNKTTARNFHFVAIFTIVLTGLVFYATTGLFDFTTVIIYSIILYPVMLLGFFYRIHLLLTPLNNPVEIPQPEIQKIERKNFTALEIGAIVKE